MSSLRNSRVQSWHCSRGDEDCTYPWWSSACGFFFQHLTFSAVFLLCDGIFVPWIHCCSSCVTALPFEVEQERICSSAVPLLPSMCKAKVMLGAGCNPFHEFLRVVASQFVERQAVPGLILVLFPSEDSQVPTVARNAAVPHWVQIVPS